MKYAIALFCLFVLSTTVLGSLYEVGEIWKLLKKNGRGFIKSMLLSGIYLWAKGFAYLTMTVLAVCAFASLQYPGDMQSTFFQLYIRGNEHLILFCVILVPFPILYLAKYFFIKRLDEHKSTYFFVELPYLIWLIAVAAVAYNAPGTT